MDTESTALDSVLASRVRLGSALSEKILSINYFLLCVYGARLRRCQVVFMVLLANFHTENINWLLVGSGWGQNCWGICSAKTTFSHAANTWSPVLMREQNMFFCGRSMANNLWPTSNMCEKKFFFFSGRAAESGGARFSSHLPSSLSSTLLMSTLTTYLAPTQPWYPKVKVLSTQDKHHIS